MSHNRFFVRMSFLAIVGGANLSDGGMSRLSQGAGWGNPHGEQPADVGEPHRLHGAGKPVF